MFQSLTLRQRLFATIILSGGLFLVFGLLYILNYKNNLVHEVMHERSESLKVVLNERLKAKEEFGLGLAVMLASNPLVQEYLHTDLRPEALIVLNSIIKNFANNTNYRGLRVQVHTQEGRSWLRTWDPDSYGDDLLYRPSITKIVTEKRPFATSTETGKVGFAVRGVAPIFYAGQYLGSLEVLQGVGSVSRDFEADGQAYIMLLNKSITNESPNIANNQKIGEDYLLANNHWFNQYSKDFAASVDFKNLESQLGKSWFVTHLPLLDIKGDLIGMHLIGEPVAVINTQVAMVTHATWIFMGLLLLLILGMGGSIAWQVQRKMVAPIVDLQQQLGVITRTLNLSKRVTIIDRAELGDLAMQINGLLDRLELAINGVLGNSKRLTATASHLAHTAGLVERNPNKQQQVGQSMAAAVDQMSSSIAEITSTMEELSASSTQIADHSQSVVDVANLTLDSSKKGADAMQLLQLRMTDINQDSISSLQEIMQLGQKSKEISKVMDLINTLADQTKLIAFNAALEASSAGESGKRFSVVASEIRRLADSVTDSTHEIEDRVQEIQDSISRLVITSEKGASSIQLGMQVSSETAQDLDALVKTSSRTSNAAQQISLSTKQQKTASSQVVIALHDIANASSRNAESVRSITEISEEMLHMSGNLNQLVHEFKVQK